MTPPPEATTDGSETDPFSQEFDLDDTLHPDEMASQLNKKASNIINSRKRRRPSKRSPIISPKIRNKAAKKVSIAPKVSVPSENQMLKQVMDKLEEMSTAMNSIRNDLNESVLNSAIVASEVQSLKELLGQKDAKIAELQTAVSRRDETIAALETRVDKVERDVNKNTVVLTSPHFKERSLQESMECVSQITGISADTLYDGSEWQKFGKKGDQVIVNAFGTNMRMKLFKKIRSDTSRSCFISEFLTPKNNSIFYEARKQKRERQERRNPRNIHSVYTYMGQVFIRQAENSDPVLIRELGELEKFFPAGPANENASPLVFDPRVPPPLLRNPTNRRVTQ